MNIWVSKEDIEETNRKLEAENKKKENTEIRDENPAPIRCEQ
ncbi:MAG: hypothetical protein ARM1_0637 [Candidatus Micrarchaeota archaeon]|nr:MAG: hypothetical protein ARM1_0637 [Candidatus Micrarchaeota archaeon]